MERPPHPSPPLSLPSPASGGRKGLTKQSIARRNVSIHRNAGSGENELSDEMNWFFAASPTLMRYRPAEHLLEP
jgi:hypothetical protein